MIPLSDLFFLRFLHGVDGAQWFCEILLLQRADSLVGETGEFAVAVDGSLAAAVDVLLGGVRLPDPGVDVVAAHRVEDGEGALL